MAPEQILTNTGYDYSIDIWSLGCCLYEMVSGDPPFRGETIEEMRDELLQDDIVMKDFFSKQFVSLLNGLMDKDVQQRLTLDEVKKHAFFKNVDWALVLEGNLKAPIIPKAKNEGDTQNIDKKIKAQDIFVHS